MKLIFKIIQIKPEPITWSLAEMQRYPVHEHHLMKGEEVLLVYEFEPTRKVDIEKYKEFLCSHFKRKYNAYSVTVGDVEKSIGQ